MTVEQQVDALTASVEDLKGAVVSRKANLDASVADAQSATVQAQAAKANALSARDQAEAFKDSAYIAAQSADSTVAYQDLSAVALTKAVTAIDLFIYDTSKDSDGGAWRHRCAGTSWYREPLNTATRGARREFPAVAVIVAESNKVTIYDGDDPALPMWMVFAYTNYNGFINWASNAGNGVEAVAAANGQLVNVSGRGSWIADFVRDEAKLIHTSASAGLPKKEISNRNSSGAWGALGQSVQLSNASHIDVAVTVMPDAPIDPATGLPIPTIAVMTGGGISVIRHDGSVFSATSSTYLGARLAFDDFGGLYWSRGADGSVFYTPKPTVSLTTFNFGVQNNALGAFGAGLPKTVDGTIAYGTSRGLARVKANLAASASAMVAYAASNYATGWLPGDIRGAFLADTDDADLVAMELITNGTFDTDATGWSATGGAGLSSVDGKLKINNDTANFGGTTQTIATAAGRAYVLTGQIEIGNTAITFRARNEPNSAVLATRIVNTTGAYKLHFVALSSTTQVQIINADGTIGDFSLADDISVRPADADRSVNNRGLVVNGTITRAPVATGAELVYYSGFSARNYLEQPYNSGLDFGIGGFCAMGWVRQISGSAGYVMERRDQAAVGNYIRIYLGGDTIPVFGTNGRTLVGSMACGLNQWAHVCCVREGSTMAIYVNGVLDTTANGQFDVTNAEAVLRFGRAVNVSALQFFGFLALWRIVASVPTADQIRRIYEDEKVLFQENAACTLYGASDAVNALAHDPDTGLLHVGTSAGRSVFKGLRRVANTTVPVGAAIAAAGGMVVEE